MTKKILMGIALVAGFISCTEDYTDWSAPQSNPAHQVLPASVLMVEPTVSAIDFTSETREVIQLFTTNLQADEYTVTFSGVGTSNECELTANADGEIATEALQKAVSDVYGGGSEERTMYAKVSAKILRETEDGYVVVNTEAEPFEFKATLPAGAVFDTDPVLYMTGNVYGWGATWVPMVPVWGHPNMSWLVIYLHEGEEFKFAPQAGWGGDFGMEVNIEDPAGMNPQNSGGNIKVGNPGWYLIQVDNDPDEGATITFHQPKIYLVGNTSPAGWGQEESGLFTIPDSEAGQFVSPQFQSSDEVRMCVKFDDVEWWQTEFVVLNGQIDYRGAGDDQTRVRVTAGHRCYLNFNNGSGVYKE